MIPSQSEIATAINEIRTRSQTDMNFRKLALNNPSAAVKQAANIDVPSSFKVRFVEPEGANMIIALPPVTGEASELSDTELEQVAGGRSSPSTPSFGSLVNLNGGNW